MATIQTRSDLLGQLRGVAVSPARAKQALDRATELVGLGRKEELNTEELLILLEALTSEGGAVQQFAEELAADTLRAALTARQSGPQAA